MTHKELDIEIKTIQPLQVELLHDKDYAEDLKDSELYSDNLEIVIKDGYVSKKLLYSTQGTYLDAPEFEFSDLEIVINKVNVYNKQGEKINLTDNQNLKICNYIRLNSILE